LSTAIVGGLGKNIAEVIVPNSEVGQADTWAIMILLNFIICSFILRLSIKQSVFGIIETYIALLVTIALLGNIYFEFQRPDILYYGFYVIMIFVIPPFLIFYPNSDRQPDLVVKVTFSYIVFLLLTTFVGLSIGIIFAYIVKDFMQLELRDFVINPSAVAGIGSAEILCAYGNVLLDSCLPISWNWFEKNWKYIFYIIATLYNGLYGSFFTSLEVFKNLPWYVKFIIVASYTVIFGIAFETVKRHSLIAENSNQERWKSFIILLRGFSLAGLINGIILFIILLISGGSISLYYLIGIHLIAGSSLALTLFIASLFKKAILISDNQS